MRKLVFVYNGDSGLINGLMHYLHKRISPDTYPCQLCGLVYDGITLKQEWLTFVQSLRVETEFLHRDEYRQRYGKSAHEWPAVLLHEDRTLKALVLGAKDFDGIASLDVLKQRLGDFVSREFPNRSIPYRLSTTTNETSTDPSSEGQNPHRPINPGNNKNMGSVGITYQNVK